MRTHPLARGQRVAGANSPVPRRCVFSCALPLPGLFLPLLCSWAEISGTGTALSCLASYTQEESRPEAQSGVAAVFLLLDPKNALSGPSSSYAQQRFRLKRLQVGVVGLCTLLPLKKEELPSK